jgi:hypothetical protein
MVLVLSYHVKGVLKSHERGVTGCQQILSCIVATATGPRSTDGQKRRAGTPVVR